MVQEINSNNISHSNIFLGINQIEAFTIQNPSFSLQSLAEKSSINPIKSVWNWVTGCLKAVWQFICLIFCCKTYASPEVGNQSISETKNSAGNKEHFLSEIKTWIIDSLPADFEKLIIYLRYGKVIYQEVFTNAEKSNILGQINAWLALQEPADATNACAYVFTEEKQKGLSKIINKPIQKMEVFKTKDHASVDRSNGIASKSIIKIDKATSYLKDVKEKDNKVLLEEILPQLNKQFNVEQTKRVKFLIEE